MKKGLTELVFILDQSGSMAPLTSDTINGFNEMVSKQKESTDETLLSLVLFNSTYDVVYERMDLKDVPILTTKDYKACGCTALVDAIGKSIHHTEKVHDSIKEKDVPEKTLFVITTDGMDNLSREYTSKTIKEMIKEKQEIGWEFIFLGSELDPVETVELYGIKSGRASKYTSSSYGERQKFNVLSDTISDYRKTGFIKDNWNAKLMNKQKADIWEDRTMNNKYKFEYHNNHPVVEIDGRNYVVDTGSPISFFVDGHNGILTINNKSFNLKNNPMGINRDSIEDLIGKDINGFLGLDILFESGSIYMNRQKGYALFGDNSFNLANKENIQKRSLMGLNMLEIPVTLNGISTTAIIDSGACISYVSSELIKNSKCTGTIYDYSPSFGGDIHTEKYEMELDICGFSCKAEMAKMTSMIEMSVGLLGYKVVMGFGEIKWSELLMDFDSNLISFE